MGFGAEIHSYMASHLETYTSEVYHALTGSWPARTIVTLYILGVGYAILKGNGGEHTKELGISMLLLLIFQGMTLVEGGFSEWISQPLFDLTSGLSSVAVGGGNGINGVFDSLDDGLGRILDTVSRIEPTGNFITNAWMYFKVGLASLLLALVYSIMYVVFIALYLMAIFGLYMMMMVGGIFVWLASFRITRGLTWTWVKATMNYVLWAFFLSAVAGFMMKLLNASIDDVSTWDLAVDGAAPPSLMSLMFLCVLTIYFLMKASDLASSLTGGSAMSGGLASSMLSAGGSAGRAATRPGGMALMNATGSMASKGAGAAWGAARGGAARAFSALKGIK